eukprot:gene1126-1287_t
MTLAGVPTSSFANWAAQDAYGGPDGRISAYHWTFRPTNIQCFVPPCDQFLLQKVNTNEDEVAITKFVFDTTNSLINKSDVLDAPTGSVVVFGVFQGTQWPGHYKFRIVSYYRALPFTGITSIPTGRFLRFANSGIVCITQPCPTVAAIELNTGVERLIFGYGSPYTNLPLFDNAWLHEAMFDTQAYAYAILQANIGADNSASIERAFVNLPDPTNPCPPIAWPSCTKQAGNTPVYTRDTNRCIVSDGCTIAGACIKSIPSCEPGYTLVSHISRPFACPAYFCDADFLLPTPRP